MGPKAEIRIAIAEFFLNICTRFVLACCLSLPSELAAVFMTPAAVCVAVPPLITRCYLAVVLLLNLENIA
jgi:hypothetical protein